MKVTVLPITQQINGDFRSYAIYTLENRGIPNWYDTLTNVQRLILLNAPTRFSKTISVMGDCIKSGYHHGDSSLAGAINKLARPFNTGMRLLEGDGFFGSQISQEAAAPRYTAVRLNPAVSGYISEFSHLNSLNDEGTPEPLHLSLPVGLLTNIVGIAVGYKTVILPRKMESILKYIEGKQKSVPPHFDGFTGKIVRHNDLPNSWLIEGNIEIDDKDRTISISSLPPLMRYEALTKKLDSLLGEIYFDLQNNSSTDINVQLVFSKTLPKEEWELAKSRVEKMVKLIVTENIIFTKDGSVLVYARIEDYLDDFKDNFQRTVLKHKEHSLAFHKDELDFLKWKLKYLEFMLVKKRKDDEITAFIEGVPSNISRRLDAIRLRTLSEDEVIRTKNLISDNEIKITEIKRDITTQKKIVAELPKSLRTSQRSNTMKLIQGEEEEYDGITMYSVDDEESNIEV